MTLSKGEGARSEPDPPRRKNNLARVSFTGVGPPMLACPDGDVGVQSQCSDRADGTASTALGMMSTTLGGVNAGLTRYDGVKSFTLGGPNVGNTCSDGAGSSSSRHPRMARGDSKSFERRFNIGAERADKRRSPFPYNSISTTKYAWWNIVPKNLLEQFRRIANIWFLFVSACQLAPLELSPTTPTATLLPLCGVLFLTFLKDAYEDHKRARDDRRVNNQLCSVLDQNSSTRGAYVQTYWKDLTVGQYVRLERDEPIPCDMILLSCSNNADGIAHVDTAQLDGETSLKPKFPLEETMRMTSPKEFCALEGHVAAEPPNQLLQYFNGMLVLRGRPRGVPVEAKNFLLRGSTLRNTKWAFGLTTYTGHETKLVQNLKQTPSKRSHVEVKANSLLLIVFGLLVTAALSSTVAQALSLREGTDSANQRSWVWPESDPLKDNGYLAFVTFMILFNNFIPISLYIATDLVRAFQGVMMERDVHMYHSRTDSFCQVRNSSLNENLGQVEFVLTDKTGTLTENQMRFKAASIGGKVYGYWDEGPVAHVASVPPLGACLPLHPALLQKAREASASTDPPQLREEAKGAGAPLPARGPRGACAAAPAANPIQDLVAEFFLCLATCHEAIPERSRASTASALPARPGSAAADAERSGSADEDLMHEAKQVVFRSSSPDEEALVAAARDFGFFFRKKVARHITVNVKGQDQHFVVLAINEFTSERKRMSVLVRQLSSESASRVSRAQSKDGAGSFGSSELHNNGVRNGKMSVVMTVDRLPSINDDMLDSESENETSYSPILYAKGADSVMLEQSRLSASGMEVAESEDFKKHLLQFTSHGLRTLVICRRQLTTLEADTFLQRMREAKGAFMNREKMMGKIADDMERSFDILGLSAVEDRIQDKVPETIDLMIRAGIKVWMLTGDNVETAVNIALACKLVDNEMRHYKLAMPDVPPDRSSSHLLSELEQIYKGISQQVKLERSPGAFRYCLIMHGKVLYTIMDDPRLRQLFLAVACCSSSVVACRLAPAQKAQLVKLVRSNLEGSPLTLAVGDGGNDVSMIQEAHVGVGILGLEGRQAANASDFTIGRFWFLQRLLFVHGRWNLRRTSIVIGYFFYKNFLLILPMIFFGRETGYSGTTLYDSYLLATFNLVFTSLPIMITGIFDWDVSPRLALNVPSLYQMGIMDHYFNWRMLMGWISRGILHASVLYTCMQGFVGGLNNMPADSNLSAPDLYVMGSWAYGACVIVGNVTIMMQTRSWMDWQLMVIGLSVVVFVPAMLIYSRSGGALMSVESSMVGIEGPLFLQPRNWLAMLLVVAACAAADFAASLVRRAVAPTVADVLGEVDQGHLSGLDRLPAVTSAAAAAERGPAGCAPAAQEWVRRLPPPLPRPLRARPDERLWVRPLRGHWDRGRSPCRCRRRRRASAAVHAEEHATQEAVAGGEGEAVLSASLSLWGQSQESLSDRVRKQACLLVRTVWERQWSEMTVAELAGGISFDKITVSKHLTSAIRQCGGLEPRSTRSAASFPNLANWASESSISHQLVVSSVSTGTHGTNDEAVLPGDVSPLPKISRKNSTSSLYSVSSRLSVSSDLSPRLSSASENEVIKDLMYSVATLRFRARAQEVAFRKFLSVHAVPLFQKFCFLSMVLFLFYNMVTLVLDPDSGSQVFWTRLVILGLSAAVGSSWLLVRLFHQRLYRPDNVAWLTADNAFEPATSVLLMASLMLKHIFDICTGNPGILFHTYTPVFIIAFARMRFTYLVMVISCHLALIVARFWILVGVFQDIPGNDIGMEYFVLMLGIVNLTLYYSYQLEILVRKDFFVLDSIAQSEHQGMEILKGMFPEEVVSHVLLKIRRDTAGEAMAAGQRILGDRIASVLFIDLMDFDALVADLQPEELVLLLDQVWNLFDRLVERNGVTKIETVGKTYMAAALPEDSAQTPLPGQHAQDALSATATAVFMLEETSRRFTGHGKVAQVSVRIGIHTGRVLSGVVGTLKPQFALFGDTVNTASRMQSTGKRNKLHVSGATWEHLKDDTRFSWEPRKTEVKGKGLMDTYLLRRYKLEELKKLRRRISAASVDKAHCNQVATAQKVSGFQASLSRVLAPKDTKTSSTSSPSHDDESVVPELPLSKPLPISERLPSMDQPSSRGLVGGEGEERGTVGVPTLRKNRTWTGITNRASTSRGDDGSPESTNHWRDERSRSSPASSNALHGEPEAAWRGLMPPTPASRLPSDLPVTPRSAILTWPRRLAPSSKASSASLGELLPGMACSAVFGLLCPVWRREAKGAQLVRGSPMMSQFVSFVGFLFWYAVESLFLLTRADAVVGELLLRLGFVVASLVAAVLLWRAGAKCHWGAEQHRSPIARTMLALFGCIVALAVFVGFVFSTAANHVGGRASVWNIFEAFFFVVVLMHLYRLFPQGLGPAILALLISVYIVVESFFCEDMMLECIGYCALILGTHVVATREDPRMLFAQHRQVCEEHERVSELLDSMLPREVLSEMRSNSLSLAYSYEDMTFLFADIVGFTRYCAEHTAEQAVNLVTQLFAVFDDEARRKGVYKVCTIGDAYVVVNEPRRQRAGYGSPAAVDRMPSETWTGLPVFEMGRWMLQAIVRVRGQEDVQHHALDMRIGIHFGKFVGGVIGTKRLRFDIWGDDVLIGNNVESHGKAGKVCVSSPAKEAMERAAQAGVEGLRGLRFAANEDIVLKNGRVVQTFLCDWESHSPPSKESAYPAEEHPAHPAGGEPFPDPRVPAAPPPPAAAADPAPRAEAPGARARPSPLDAPPTPHAGGEAA
ncbi:unnamed protein product, partial [Prorocentrum cordatum]